MATRFGWGKNGGTTLGDVRDALAGRAFGYGGAPTVAVSPTKTAIDASLGSDFLIQLRASSVFKIGNPTNDDDSTELVFHLKGITTFGTVVWDTAYALTGAIATFSTAKVKSIAFRKVPGLTTQYREIWRTTSEAV
jgi:hypothetical protein